MKRKIILLIILFFAFKNNYAQTALCASTSTSFGYERVNSVTLNGVYFQGNTTYTGPGYYDYSSTPMPILQAGTIVPLSVVVQTNGPYQQYVKLWIDFNNNGNLEDAGELVFDQNYVVNNTTYTFSGNITVPPGAFNGPVRMRLIMQYSASPQLCGNYPYGNTFDFGTSVQGGVDPIQLTVNKTGTGNVVSNPSGINTATNLNFANFGENTNVTLTATPIAPQTFIGWSGDASGSTNPLTVTIDQAKTITANFAQNSPPQLSSLSASNVSFTTATLNANVTSGGSTTVTSRGFYYGLSPNPTSNNTIITGTTGAMSTNLTGLLPGTVYYFRAYATNSIGTTNIGDGTFTTLPPCSSLIASAVSQTNVSCNGGTNGSATVSASGTTAPYSYSWSPSGGTAATASGLSAGTYTVTVTDANGCTATQNFTITQPTAISLTANTQTSVSCNGGSNGAASVSVSGGTAGYTYNWTPGNPTGDGTASVTGLTSGTWTCIVTDANGCTATQNFIITQPATLALTAASQTNVACNGGATGAASVNTPTGGTGPYSYNWTPGNPTGDGTASITGLVAGTYTCTVTDANSCTATVNFTITQPPALVLTAASQTNVSCNGGSNGAASVNTATGGAGSYTYNWTPGNPSGDGTVSVTGLTAGTWTCTVTDANGCTTSQNFTVTQPTAISLTTNSQTNVSCNGGSNGAASINTPTGGTGSYTYNWTPGNPTGDGTASVTGLTAGTWTCTVTDANGCTATQNFTITQPATLALTAASQTNVACNGGSNGAASVNAATGGAGGYTYNWTPGNPTGDGTASITGLVPGTYTCTVTDANSCTATVNFTITQPPALVLTAASQTNVSCNGGSNGAASVNAATGGAGGYTYNWTPGNPTGDGTASVTGLVPGTYTCTVTDANSCTATVNFTITQPTALSIASNSQTQESCVGANDGTATISISGGTGGYTYSWAPSGGTAATASGLTAGSYTVTATDANGCTISQAYTITTVLDVTNPTISAPADVAINTNTGCTATGVTLGTPIVADNCTVASYSSNAPAVFLLGTTIVTWTVTDGLGNTATATQNVVVTDVEVPNVITQDVTVQLDSNGLATITPSMINDGSTDNCGIDTITLDNLSFDCSNVGSNTVTLIVTDVNGNVATDTAIVTVQDVIDPTVITQDITITLNGSGQAVITSGMINNGSFDNCGIASISVSQTNFDCTNLGTNTVTLTIIDVNGNSNSATAVVTVIDTTNPVAIAQNITLPLDANGQLVITPAQLDNGSYDNCDFTLSVAPNSFSSVNVGDNTVIFVIADASGNSHYTTATVTILDTIDPIVITQNITVNLDSNGSATITANQVNNGSTDNTSIASMSVTPSTFSCSDISGPVQPSAISVQQLAWTSGGGGTSHWQSFTATENSLLNGIQVYHDFPNSSQSTVVHLELYQGEGTDGTLITQSSNTNSGLSGSSQFYTYNFNNIVLTQGQKYTWRIYFTTAQNVGWIYFSGTNPYTDGMGSYCCNNTNDDFVFKVYSTFTPNQVTLTVTDVNGNSASGVANVTVIDAILPTITAPAAINTTTNTGCTATGIVLGSPITNDNCAVASVTNDAPVAFPLGTTTVTWTVVDASGNVATATQLVTITDTILPSITAPLAITIDTNDDCYAINVALGTPVTSDNCSVVSVTNDAPASFPIGATTVTWTVVDGSGNVSTATQVVTVEDNQLPTIVAPIAINTTTNTGCTATGLVLGNPVTTDNCSVVSVTNDAPVAFPLGATTVTWTVVDASGNVATATQIITVSDMTLPTITAPVAINTTTNTGCTATGIVLGSPITNDNCAVASVTNDAPVAFPLGTTTVTWTVVDASGNVATATQLVTITDTILPSITAPAVVTMPTNNGCYAVNVALGTPVTSDNCSVVSVTNDAPTSFPLGNTIVTWTVVDGSGNVATTTQLVTIIDISLPTIVAPYTIYTTTNTGCTTTGLFLGTPVTNDNCSVASVTNNAPVAFPLGTTTVTWTVVDGSGNIATATQIVTVTDATLPTVLTQAITVALNANGQASITAANVNNGSFDNCGVATLSVSPSTFTCANVGVNTVTLTVTDVNGNVATNTALVTVVDLISPIVLTQNITITLDDYGDASITADMIDNGSFDNCGIASITVNVEDFNCNDLGSNTVILTVTDVNGNVGTGTATVTVISTAGDNDNDGMNDNCDDDDDNDGIIDEDDNCQFEYNPNQADNDDDGLGDVCDEDDDNDGVFDVFDNCPFVYNPEQEDRDNDGIGDVCDTIEINISDAITPNGDGINDTWMIYNIENHPKNNVRVYSRWGDLVFEARNYQNEWDGHYKNRTQSLPDGGSYYYQVDLDGNGTVDYDGWLYISRK